MALDTSVPRASRVRESLSERVRRVAARASLPLAGGGLLGGGGLPAATAALGACPFCAVGVPCPVCLLGVGPLLGGVATGSLGALGFAAWSGSSTPEDAASEAEDGSGDCGGTACGCLTRGPTAGRDGRP